LTFSESGKVTFTVKEEEKRMSIIAWLLVGIIAGALARLIVPGRDPMGLLGTLVLGLVGSVLGGWLAQVLFDDNSIGIVGATLGAVVVLVIYRVATRGSSRMA